MLFTVFLFVFLAFTLLVLFVITSAFLGFAITRVPFVTTPEKEISKAVKELNITPKDTFYDLGSGNGKVCFIVNEITGADCMGFELTYWNYLLAKIKSRVISHQSRVTFKNQNFFKHSWDEAGYIYAYLYPPLMGRVEEKFVKECKPGSIAIIRDFPFPKSKPFKVLNTGKGHEIYLYKNGG